LLQVRCARVPAACGAPLLLTRCHLCLRCSGWNVGLEASSQQALLSWRDLEPRLVVASTVQAQ
jgi:hypothetical protein